MGVTPDGAAAVAGIKEGDIIVEDVWIGDLVDRFNAPSGTTAEVVIVSGGDGLPVDERQKRTVAVILP
jgi:hypothetical protein